HGFIINEKYPNIGAVSAISVTGPDTFTETRGDGRMRSFTYTHMSHCQGNECGPCDDYENNNAWPSKAPQQMLVSYTDFQANATQINYDSNWYVNSVRDANLHTTTYDRGLPPPNGTGEIKKVTQVADGTYIQYTYQAEPGAITGHYVVTVRDERGNVTTYNRNGTTHQIFEIDYPDGASETFSRNSFG